MMNLEEMRARHVPIAADPRGDRYPSVAVCAACGQPWGEKGCDAAFLLDLLTPERLAAALKAEGFVRGVANRYGSFNDVYYEQSATAILAALTSEADDDPHN